MGGGWAVEGVQVEQACFRKYREHLEDVSVKRHNYAQFALSISADSMVGEVR